MRSALFAALIFFFLGSSNVPAAEILEKGKKLDAPVCGGFADFICSDNEWCHYPDGAVCGGGDFFGT